MNGRMWLLAILVGGLLFHASALASVNTLSFDDGYYPNLTGSGYAGLTWEQGNAGYAQDFGYWATIPHPRSRPHSLPQNVTNVGGCSQIAIAFPKLVNVEGAYLATQGDHPEWLYGVRVDGYRDGELVAGTGWFRDINDTSAWAEMNLRNIDRIVFNARSTLTDGFAWFGMDDLTYSEVPEASCGAAVWLFGTVVLARRNLRRHAETK